MLSIKKILMNQTVNPKGLEQLPNLTWIIESDQRDIMQYAYHIKVFHENIVKFDSGIVESNQSVEINVENLCKESFQIQSATQYEIAVKVISNKQEESEWAYSSFVTGVLSDLNWKGEFVTVEEHSMSDESKGTYLRKVIHIPNDKIIKEAYAFTTALGLYKYYINGEKIGEDEMAPGWTSYHKRLTYQTNNITESLSPGENVIGVHLGAGWYKGLMGFIGTRNNYGSRTAFLGNIIVRYDDGTYDVFVTDTSWKGENSPVLFSEIYDGEIYDARLESDFLQVDFDDSLWKAVTVVEQCKSILVSQPASRVKMINRIKAKRVFVTPQGDTVVDFGQNLTGWIEVRTKGKKDDVIEWKCFEVLDVNGNAYFENLREAKQTIKYIIKNEEEVIYHPNFTFQGFQYAKIVSFPETPTVENFTAITVHSDMEQIGHFECSNSLLNQLQHNILWGLKGNFLDIPTDCPQRNERVGWTGDAQIFCRTASYLVNSYAFFEKWLQDVAADQTKEGGVPHVVPDIVSGREGSDWLLGQGTHSAAAWADVAVLNPWILYLTYSDKTILKKQYNSMKLWVDFMRNHAVDGIWNYKLQFGDWVALDAKEGSYFGATPNELTCTAYYAYTTRIFAKIAKVLGKMEDYQLYNNLAKDIKSVFIKNFFSEDGTMSAQTQTAHIIALYFDLVPEEYKEKVVSNLIDLLEKENGHLVTGFVGTPYFTHVLSQNGHIDKAYELLLKEDFPSWLYQVKMGATTIWEHWDGIKPDGTMWSPDMNSFNHYAYGAIGEWLYRVIAGIEIDEDEGKVGYKHFIIYPRFGGNLTYVKASFESSYGKIYSNWKIDNGKKILNVVIPVNSSATIRLDQAVNIVESDGIEFKMPKNYVHKTDYLEGEATSGNYTIIFE